MQLCCHSIQQQQDLQQLVPWAQHSTDPPKLRSLLLYPSKFPAVQLYLQHCSSPTSSSYAIARDESVQGGERYGIYGNLLEKPNYEHAAEQIVSMSGGGTCRFSALPAAAVPALRTVFSRYGYKELYHSPCWEYTLQGSITEQLQGQDFRDWLQRQLGSQYELSTLQLHEAELVNSLWTYKGPDTLALIQQLIAGNHTSCIRTKADQEPVAWMLETDPGMAGILHTLQQHRRKGLARVTLLDLLQKLHKQHLRDNEKLQKHQQQQQQHLQHQEAEIDKGKGPMSNGDVQHEAIPYCVLGGQVYGVAETQQHPWPGGHVYAYVVQDNNASLALFANLGLTRSSEFWWIGFEKAQHAAQ